MLRPPSGIDASQRLALLRWNSLAKNPRTPSNAAEILLLIQNKVLLRPYPILCGVLNLE